MDVTGVFRSSLFRHDRRLAENGMRSALARWGDRLFLGAVGIIALAVLNHVLSDRPLTVVAGVVLVASALTGLGMARLIHRRLEFHASDGALAAEALCGRTRMRYGLALHLLAAGATLVVALVVRPEAALVAPIGYLAGALVGHALCAILPEQGAGPKGVVPRALQAVLRRPVSGVVVAGVLVLILPGLGAFDPAREAVFAGILGAIAALVLTMVDDSAVRFMTLSGYPAGRIVGRQARPLLLCLALTVPVAFILSGSLTAVVMAGVGATALVLMVARILAYRVYDRRIADVLLGVCAMVCAVAGVTFPPAVPVIVLAVLWALARRSGPATWSLA